MRASISLAEATHEARSPRLLPTNAEGPVIRDPYLDFAPQRAGESARVSTMLRTRDRLFSRNPTG